MIRLVAYTFVTAIVGAIVALLLTEALAEGAIVGALIGGSIGVIVFISRNASTVSYEFEAAGIPDDNLTTTARRNLVREANRSNYNPYPAASEVANYQEPEAADLDDAQSTTSEEA